MPPPLPERYQLLIRLDRDHDIEQWLGYDTELDRPVLLRSIGPFSGPERAEQFLAAQKAASGCTHPHLVAVFAAALTEGGAFSVSAWSSGITWQDRLDHNQLLDPTNFLTCATGLADALAEMHRHGVVHGSIDPSAVTYSGSQPARLGGFGRPSKGGSRTKDVIALGNVLEQIITGEQPNSIGPSQMVDGLSPRIDRILGRAQQGVSSARQLADDLAALPPQPPREEDSALASSSRISSMLTLVLGAAAILLVLLGVWITDDSGQPILLPPAVGTTSPIVLPTTTSTIRPQTQPQPILVAARNPNSYDPFGEGGENDQILVNLVDGDPSTFWRTERYFDPIQLIKPGVGITFEAGSVPETIELVDISPGVRYRLGWSAGLPPSPEQWETIATGTTMGGTLSIQVPPRVGGVWLVWIVGVPQLGETNHAAAIAEIRLAV